MSRLSRDARGLGLLVYLVALVALLGAVYGLVRLLDETWATSAGRRLGAAEVQALYAARDAEALEAARRAEAQAREEARKAEAAMLEALARASAEYQRGVQDGRTKLEDARRAVRDRGGLRDPGRAAGTAAGGGGGAAEAAASAARGDGAEGGYLSQQAVEFLLELAAEADDVVRQLTACQAVIAADRL